MGTRCLTVFMDGEKEIAVMYRQLDGYLDGHGKELADFLKNKTIVNGMGAEPANTIFNGMACLAAAVVAHFKTEPGGFYLHPVGTRDRGEDYTYIVSGEIGEEPIIAVEDFQGNASDYQAWLEGQAESD